MQQNKQDRYLLQENNKTNNRTEQPSERIDKPLVSSTERMSANTVFHLNVSALNRSLNEEVRLQDSAQWHGTRTVKDDNKKVTQERNREEQNSWNIPRVNHSDKRLQERLSYKDARKNESRADTENVHAEESYENEETKDEKDTLSFESSHEFISGRKNVSKLHADDMLTTPTKMSMHFSYRITTHGTYEGQGMNTAHAVYMPVVIMAANRSLRMMANGSLRRYVKSKVFQQICKELVFDFEGASDALEKILRKNAVSQKDIIRFMERISSTDFVPGRDAEVLFKDFKHLTNQDTGNPFTQEELTELIRELRRVINQYTPNVEGINPRILTKIMSYRDLKEQSKMLNAYLRKHGLAGRHSSGLGDLSGTASIRQLKRLLRRNDLSSQEIAVVKHTLGLQAAAKISLMSNKNLGIVHGVYRKAKQMLSQTYAGAGIGLMIDIIRTSIKTIKYGIHASAALGRGSKFGIRIISRPVSIGMKVAKQQLMKISAVDSAVNGYIKPILTPVINTVKETTDTIKNYRKNVHRAKQIKSERGNKFIRNMNAFTREPFRVKERMTQKWRSTIIGKGTRRATGTAGRFMHFLSDILAKVVSVVSGAYTTVMSFWSGILMIVLILVLIVFLVQYLCSYVFGLFSLESEKNEGEIRIIDKCIEEINELYEEQMNYIDSLYNKSRYRNVTVQFNDKKNYDLYELYDKEENGGNLYAYTNSREILAMAKVRFDYDLSSASETEVLNYVRQLFNGSHIYSITETAVYETNEEGKKTATGQYDAAVVYTTYYFDSLFDCQLSGESFVGIAGTTDYECIGNSNAEKIWNYFMQAGFTKEGAAGIMGNIMHESYPAFEPASLELASIRKSGISSEEYTKMVDDGKISRVEVISSSRFGLYLGGRYGYGLCQFTYPTIKEYLCMCTIDVGKSIGDLYGQLDSLICYLEDYEPDLLDYMKTADNPHNAAARFLREYEKPSDMENAQIKRCASAQEIYESYYDYTYLSEAS